VVAGCRGGQGRHLHRRSVASAQACLACWRAAASRWDGDSRCSRVAHGTRREAPGRTGTGWDDPTAYAKLEAWQNPGEHWPTRRVRNLGSDVRATAPVDQAEDEALKEIALRWTPVGGGTMTDHPHIELFRRTYAAFTTGTWTPWPRYSLRTSSGTPQGTTRSRATTKAAMPPSTARPRPR
jgi:hypothetical protein